MLTIFAFWFTLPPTQVIPLSLFAMSFSFSMLTCSHHSISWKNQPVSQSVSSIAQSCPTLCDSMNRSTPGLPVHHQLPEITQTHIHQVSDSIKLVMPSSHLILCRPLLLLPPIPPSIRVFSNEASLHMRWPKYWSFSSTSALPMNTQD